MKCVCGHETGSGVCIFHMVALASLTSINKLQVMQNVALRTATGWTHTYNICMTKHTHFPYTSTYSSMPHNTNRKHNIYHIPYTNTQHTSTPKAQKPIFNNGCYSTNIPTDPHTVTTTDIVHTSIVSKHLDPGMLLNCAQIRVCHKSTSRHLVYRKTIPSDNDK